MTPLALAHDGPPAGRSRAASTDFHFAAAWGRVTLDRGTLNKLRAEKDSAMGDTEQQTDTDSATANAGHRGRGRYGTITRNGETLTVPEWAARLGISRARLVNRIAELGLEGAFTMRERREAIALETGRAATGARSIEQGHASDLQMAASSALSAKRDLMDGDHQSSQGSAYLAYKFLRGYLRRAKFSLAEEDALVEAAIAKGRKLASGTGVQRAVRPRQR